VSAPPKKKKRKKSVLPNPLPTSSRTWEKRRKEKRSKMVGRQNWKEKLGPSAKKKKKRTKEELLSAITDKSRGARCGAMRPKKKKVRKSQ